MAWLALVATVLATAYAAKEQSRAGKQAAQAAALELVDARETRHQLYGYRPGVLLGALVLMVP